MRDHFDGQRFFNTTGTAGQPFTEVPRMLREPRSSWPRHVEVAVQTPPPLGDAAAAVTFVGHSTFLIQTPAGNLRQRPSRSLGWHSTR